MYRRGDKVKLTTYRPDIGFRSERTTLQVGRIYTVDAYDKQGRWIRLIEEDIWYLPLDCFTSPFTLDESLQIIERAIKEFQK